MSGHDDAHRPAFEWVLFDLGGVLVELDGVASLQRLAAIDDPAELWRRWLSCPWVRRFERGQCTTGEFVAGLIEEWRLPVSEEAFVAEFEAWPARLFDGALELVSAVAEGANTGCLSNSNALHWERLTSALGLGDVFEQRFLSHEIGLIKPDREIFDHVAAALGISPEGILFLDDNPINVAAAASAGFAAAVAAGVECARSVLLDVGVLLQPQE